ncbi:GAF domain-containing sensor histidine kinase [Calothrix sp. NIES-3974]|uniref:GAF domain-containing sensor histidine kinase n=1 Tax=Calothrix sp. NIES-3974 TaxID=2005462 RepID=UPI000B616FE1|nr:GAF domain-containing sensor histidine kinase [Calothrix sp. NIES-3974]BAZ05948.1 GAF sensor signal transduction histidine kinase [Calothrix sp. NIES-3974]
MTSSPDVSFSRTLPNCLYQQLGKLLQQMAQTRDNPPMVLTDALTVRIPHLSWPQMKFLVVLSDGFNAMLQAKPSQLTLSSNLQSIHEQKFQLTESTLLDVELTFDHQAIATFVSCLVNLFPPHLQTYQKLQPYCQDLSPNDITLQQKFTLLLLDFSLTLPAWQVQQPGNFQSESEPTIAHNNSACLHVETALQKQIAQEKLLNQVNTQIRKSLDLPVIMQTAVARVREFLELDRIVVYKFEYPNSSNHSPVVNGNYHGGNGCIVYEVRSSTDITSVLNYSEETCFTPTNECWLKYQKGFTLAVEDVEQTYPLESCLLEFMRTCQVRAKFVAPIVFENRLWGLLIAHQCTQTRRWQENETNLLTSIAEQLAIAIHQAELMRSLTQEKLLLEQRVVERTSELHDALVAAEAAGRVRNEFLATISHELLTPLTYVIGMSSTLLRWSFGELSQRQRDYLQTIHDSGEHLLGMINDILDLSQIEAGKTVLKVTNFSLSQIAQASIKSIEAKAVNQQINLKLDLKTNQHQDDFTADPHRIQQIIGNLLSNAVKFTPAGGNVILRVWVEENTAIFQVEDTGIGIPENQLPRLFEKFHQLDTPYRRRYEGTGLGLALTKQLVELHRGRIEVESTEGIGSIFTVWIPMQRITEAIR